MTSLLISPAPTQTSFGSIGSAGTPSRPFIAPKMRTDARKDLRRSIAHTAQMYVWCDDAVCECFCVLAG